MKPYADTNLFTRLYLDLPGSDEADALVELARSGMSEPLPVSWLHRVETTNAFELSVFLGRSPEHPRVSSEQAAIALATFREDVSAAFFLRPVRLPEAVLERQFEELALRFTGRNGFRTYDILHVASALVLECDIFWSFDERALRLAKLAGLRIPTRKTR